jgi:hypothetical protein
MSRGEKVKQLVFVSCICNNNSSYSQCVNLVPKPQLGNALVGEAPRLPVTGDGPKPGLLAQTRSQAGAWERGNRLFLFPVSVIITHLTVSA